MDAWQKACEEMFLGCLQWQPGEVLCLVSDVGTAALGTAAAAEARRLGRGEVIAVTMDRRSRDGEEPPAAVAELLHAADCAVLLTSFSLSHTGARRRASENGCRTASIPRGSREMLERGLAVDHEQMAQRCGRVADVLSMGGEVRITSDLGMDLAMDISGRPLLMDTGLLGEKGAFGNLPAGEVALSPVPGSCRGLLVVDGSMSGVGLLEQPLRITVADGRAVKFEGGAQAEALQKLVASVGPLGANIAELGIGTNDRALLSGSVLEDEKVMGTIHVALGNDLSLGGTVDVPLHLDGIVCAPTLTVSGGPKLLDQGRLLV